MALTSRVPQIAAGHDEPALLPAILDPAIRQLVEQYPERLHDWCSRFGSPLNIVLPWLLDRNLQRLAAVLERHRVDCRIFYAAKVNKSRALVKAAVEAGLGVDVSSRFELRDALEAGCPGHAICASGPARTGPFYRELAEADALVSIDSGEELAELAEWAARQPSGRRLRILLRFRPSAATTSRFGIPASQMPACLAMVAAAPEAFAFEGFHFHLGGYAAASRVAALCEVAVWVRRARAMGLPVSLIDIGGGLPIRYVESQAYAQFLENQSGADYRTGRVPASFYPYGGGIDAAGWLEEFLAAAGPDGKTVAAYLRAEALTLALEPGRSLADQTAFSLFRIARTKLLPDEQLVLFVEGSSFSACETWFASEFLVDPVLVSRARPGTPPAPARAWIAGHSCLDDDVLTNRLIPFPVRPRQGDLILFGNTAGYQMDLLENEFHRVPMPRRIALSADLATAQPDDLGGTS
ncbi:Y4yA family PLP-dependent enzyme [Radicibacter daui]|uniref:Y4yA family PLP-dependent enzyme n=1 Tax=Radicibacter daui TaxID=3064829 RepID=UPI004046AEA7